MSGGESAAHFNETLTAHSVNVAMDTVAFSSHCSDKQILAGAHTHTHVRAHWSEGDVVRQPQE